MLKLIGSFVKLTVFTVAVLLMGNWIQWGGRTLSNHVLSGFSELRHVAEAPIVSTLSSRNPVSSITQSVTQEVRQFKASTKRRIAQKAQATEEDLLSVTEKMRMRNLLKEVETH